MKFSATIPDQATSIGFCPRKKLIEIQQALDDIGEFGSEPYFSDLVLSFGRN